MSTITATEVKKLRDSTGAGMMDAKRALTEADGDFDRAVEVLRVSGQAKAAKRAERSATNGLVASSDGALLQLGAETDFVAKNEEFQRLAADAVAAVAANRADGVEAANAAALPSGKTVAEAVEELAVKIGEKLEISAAAYFDGQTVVYLHRRASDLPPQVGVLVEYDGTDEAAAREEGKPDQAVPRIVEGRVNAFFKDVVLLDQPSVTDNKTPVARQVADAGLTIKRFARFEASGA